MVIDDVDYDSTTLVGQSHIFLQMEKPKQLVESAHMTKEFRHDLSSRKEDAVIISTKDGDCKKHTGAKAKKHAATLIVGKDILLSEVPKYLSLALVGRFCRKKSRRGRSPKVDGRKLESPYAAATNVPYFVERMDFVLGQDRGGEAAVT